jgi:group I intron endonuclease
MQFNYEGHSLKSGVYKLTNLSNQRFYIGSCKRFKERWKEHQRTLVAQKHHNRYLLSDFNKCGSEAFVFEVLELVEGTKEERLEREQFYLDLLFDNQNLCYNLRKEACTPEGQFPKDTVERKQKRSEAFKKTWKDPLQREKITNSMKERWQDPEYKEQISKAVKANFNSPKGKKIRKQVGEGNKGRMAKPYALVSPEGQVFEGTNMSEFAKQEGLDIRGLSALMTGRRNMYHGWHKHQRQGIQENL